MNKGVSAISSVVCCVLSGCSGLPVTSGEAALEIQVDGVGTGRRTPAPIDLESGSHLVVRDEGGAVVARSPWPTFNGKNDPAVGSRNSERPHWT